MVKGIELVKISYRRRKGNIFLNPIEDRELCSKRVTSKSVLGYYLIPLEKQENIGGCHKADPLSVPPHPLTPATRTKLCPMAREECDRSSPIDRFEPINAREKNPTTFSRLCARDMRFMMANLDGHFSLFSFSRSCPVHDIYLILDVYGYIEQKIVRVTAAI